MFKAISDMEILVVLTKNTFSVNVIIEQSMQSILILITCMHMLFDLILMLVISLTIFYKEALDQKNT